MTVVLDICLAFAIRVAHVHDMRKSAVPVPESWIRKLYEDTPDPLDQYDAAIYALSLPPRWNRGKVEIWAEFECRDRIERSKDGQDCTDC